MTTISENTKVTLPIVLALISGVVSGMLGVNYIANRMDRQDRRLARIEIKLGIKQEIETAFIVPDAFAGD